jgi:hypothetical protein
MQDPRPIYVVQFALMALIAIAVFAVATAKCAAPTPTDRDCFNAKAWEPAPDSARPCVTLRGNAPEGGALTFKVADASGVVRYAGYVNTPYRQIIHVRVVRLYEDGSFTWKARSRDGRTYSASVSNLQD